MKTPNYLQPLPAMDRRQFLQLTCATAACPAAGWDDSRAEAAARLKAAIIGHTGRGDYGHGLESIFSNRPNIELIALADPDADGRAKTAAKIGPARQYADYREMLEKERPHLVSIAM